MAGPVRIGLRRQFGAEGDVRMQQRHREEALQVGLLVDREELGAVLDAVEDGLVHVEPAKLDTRSAAPACMIPLAALSASPG